MSSVAGSHKDGHIGRHSPYLDKYWLYGFPTLIYLLIAMRQSYEMCKYMSSVDGSHDWYTHRTPTTNKWRPSGRTAFIP